MPKELVIPTTVSYVDCTYNVTSIAASAFENNETVDTVIIHNGITSIGKYAFAGSTIRKIIIGENVSSIGIAIISYCYNLEEIVVNQDNKYFCTLDNEYLLSKNKRVLWGTINLGDIITVPTGVTTVKEKALTANAVFDGNKVCKILKRISFPWTVKWIAKDNMDARLVVFSGKTTPKIYENLTDIRFVVVTKGNIDEYKNMKYNKKNVFDSNVKFTTKITYKTHNNKFLSNLDPEDYTENEVYYKGVSNYTKELVNSWKEENPDISERELVLKVLHEIRENYTLDQKLFQKELNSEEARTAEFLFTNKKGETNSYCAKAQYMLREIGIPCVTIDYTRDFRNGYSNEIFNAAYVNGNWIIFTPHSTASQISLAFNHFDLVSFNAKIKDVYDYKGF